MRTTSLFRAIGLAILAGTMASATFHVSAQQAPDASAVTTSDKSSKDAKNLDSIVVTARSGVETRTKAQTSYSITTIDEDRLRMQAPTSVTEAMKSVPGFWVEASGGEASGNIRARGIPVDGFGSVNLLEDGIPVQHDPALGYLYADTATAAARARAGRRFPVRCFSPSREPHNAAWTSSR